MSAYLRFLYDNFLNSFIMFSSFPKWINIWKLKGSTNVIIGPKNPLKVFLCFSNLSNCKFYIWISEFIDKLSNKSPNVFFVE